MNILQWQYVIPLSAGSKQCSLRCQDATHAHRPLRSEHAFHMQPVSAFLRCFTRPFILCLNACHSTCLVNATFPHDTCITAPLLPFISRARSLEDISFDHDADQMPKIVNFEKNCEQLLAVLAVLQQASEEGGMQESIPKTNFMQRGRAQSPNSHCRYQSMKHRMFLSSNIRSAFSLQIVPPGLKSATG